MTTHLVATFVDACRAHDTAVTRTDPEGFGGALAGLVEPPAVGAPLPFDEVSLADTPVETDLTTAGVRAATTGVCAAGFAVAETGSVVLQPTANGEEPVSLFPERHVVVVRERDLLPDVPAAFNRLADEIAAGRDDAVLATGPSATADMGELVQGVHGPNEVHVLLIADDAAAADVEGATRPGGDATDVPADATTDGPGAGEADDAPGDEDGEGGETA